MRLTGRQIILISVLVLITMVVVVCSTVFRVKTIDINFLVASTRYSEQSTIDEIVKDCTIKEGNSVFLIKKASAIEELELKYPYLQIINIEIKFPNIVRIHCVERIECYTIKLTNNTYAICDSSLRVVRISNSLENLTLIKDGYSTASVGSDIVYENSEYYSQLVSSFETLGQTPTSFKYIFKEAEMISQISSSGTLYNIKLNTSGGITIMIENIGVKLSEKVELAYTLYSDKINSSVNSGTITVSNYINGETYRTFTE